MNCFLVYFHRDAGWVDGAVPCKSFADNFMGRLMGDYIIKSQSDPFEYRGTGVDANGIIIIKGAIVRGTDFNDRIYKAVLFYLTIRIGGVAHQRRPAELKIAQIVGMVDDLGAVRIRIKRTILALMPYQTVGPVPHVTLIPIQHFGNKWLRPQVTPP